MFNLGQFFHYYPIIKFKIIGSRKQFVSTMKKETTMITMILNMFPRNKIKTSKQTT